MSHRSKRPECVCALVVAVCALAASGCATWNGPRIDPSGERVLLWPNDPQPANTGPVAPGAFQTPPTMPPSTFAAPPVVASPAQIIAAPPPPPTVGMPTGNLQAPPVYPDAGLAPTLPTSIGSAAVAPAPGPAGITIPPPTPIAPAVDAQWAIPASTTAEGGRALILTTIVNRRSDGAPLAGWIVRYEVSGAAATVGRTGGSYLDVLTDAAGRASVEVSPSEVGGGTVLVTMILLPPTEQGGAPIELARGNSTITWTPAPPGATINLPPPPSIDGGAMGPAYGGPSLGGPTFRSPSIPSASPVDTRPTLPSDTPTAGRYGQPPTNTSPPPERPYAPPPEKPPGQPRLVVSIRTTSPDPVNVGEFARFEVMVTNRGDAPARRILVSDRFDRGLEHMSAKPGEKLEYGKMRDLPPGESDSVALTFKVIAAGRLCHTVTVSAEDAITATANSCITAIEAVPATPPTLELTKQGPIRQYVNDVARFKTVIKNTGQVPVTNIEIVDQYDAALDPLVEAGAQELARGKLMWRIDRLLPNERREFNVQTACVAPAASACSLVKVTADGGVNLADQKCVEILPQIPVGGVRPPVQPPAATSGNVVSNLKLTIAESAGPARVGSPLTVFIFVENTGTQIERDVRLRVSVPQETTPLDALIRPAGQFQIVGEREIQFSTLPELRPGEKRQFDVPVRVDRMGTINFWAQAKAGDAAEITERSKPIEILPAGN